MDTRVDEDAIRMLGKEIAKGINTEADIGDIDLDTPRDREGASSHFTLRVSGTSPNVRLPRMLWKHSFYKSIVMVGILVWRF